MCWQWTAYLDRVSSVDAGGSRGSATRRRILDAAAALLAGGDPAPMGRIAQAAGVTRQLLYLHFTGRADLLLEVARDLDARIRTPSAQARVDGAPDGVSALRAAVALQGRIKPRIHHVAAAIDRLRASDADASAAWEEREAARYRRARDVVSRLEAEGLLDPVWTVPDAARLLWSATSQHAWADLVLDAGWSTARWVRHTTLLLERALLRAGGRPAGAARGR